MFWNIEQPAQRFSSVNDALQASCQFQVEEIHADNGDVCWGWWHYDIEQFGQEAVYVYDNREMALAECHETLDHQNEVEDENIEQMRQTEADYAFRATMTEYLSRGVVDITPDTMPELF